MSASLSQRYLDKILNVAVATEDDFALSATLFLEKIVTQGFANPRACVPTLIALETSTNSAIRGLAFDIHRNLHTKYESLIDGSYTEGLKRAYEYHSLQSGSFVDEGMKGSVTDLSPLYSLMKSNRNSKRKFLTSVARSLDFEFSKFSTSDMRQDVEKNDYDLRIQHLKFVRFAAYCLARISYGTVEEPHTLIHGCDKITGSTGMIVFMAVTEYQTQKMQNNQEPTSDIALQSLAIASTIVYIIWQLRQYIRQTYNLSDQACHAFTPLSNKTMKEFSRPTNRSSNDGLVLDSVCLRNEFDDVEENLIALEKMREVLAAVDAKENLVL